MLQKSIDAAHIITEGDNNHGAHWIGVAGGTIAKDNLVKFSGTSLSHGKIVQAAATDPVAADTLLMVATHSGASGDQVECADMWVISAVNTNGSSVGAPVYLSDTLGGWSLTTGTMRRRVGIVLVVSATVGVVLLQPNAAPASAGTDYTEVAASAGVTDAVLTAQTFDKTYTVKANRLRIGSIIRIRAQGIYTVSVGADTHTMDLRIGSQVIASRAGINPGANEIWYFDICLYVRTIGAGGTMVAAGVMGMGASGTSGAAIVHLASTALDTTVDKVLACAITYTATVNDSTRQDIFDVKIEN